MSIAMELELIKHKLAQAEISQVEVTDDTLIVDLRDGRTISTPILWFPRLAHGTCAERRHFEILRDSIHWPELDEDIGLPTLLLGRGLGESPQSFQRWLDRRQKAQHSIHQANPMR